MGRMVNMGFLNNLSCMIIQPSRNFILSRAGCSPIKCSESECFKNIHHYKNLYPWESFSEFVNHIISSVVFNKHGIVAINKPYGVRIRRRTQKEPNDSSVKNISHTVSYSAEEDFQYSIEEVLPNLKTALNVSDLFILKSAERYTSGIVLMSTSEKVTAKVQKSFNIAKHQKLPHLVHWMVTRGYAVEPTRKEAVGIKLVDVEGCEQKQPEIVTDISRRDRKLKRVKYIHVEYWTRAINKALPSSLIEIAISSTTFHFLRVYASSRAASILGDQLYGSRMQTIFGRPVKMSPQNATGYNVQPLPDLMCERLHLSRTVEGHLTVPTMLHLQTIILPKFINKEEDLLISAPPPTHFQWTCEQFGFVS